MGCYKIYPILMGYKSCILTIMIFKTQVHIIKTRKKPFCSVIFVWCHCLNFEVDTSNTLNFDNYFFVKVKRNLMIVYEYC